MLGLERRRIGRSAARARSGSRGCSWPAGASSARRIRRAPVPEPGALRVNSERCPRCGATRCWPRRARAVRGASAMALADDARSQCRSRRAARAPACAPSPWARCAGIAARAGWRCPLLAQAAGTGAARAAAGHSAAPARVFAQSGPRRRCPRRSTPRACCAQPRAAGMVNALLRRFLREREALLARPMRIRPRPARTRRGCSKHCASQWPEEWQQIVAANNEHPPMSLRVDLSRTQREAYLGNWLAQRGIGARRTAPGCRPRWCSSSRCRSAKLPGFADGRSRCRTPARSWPARCWRSSRRAGAGCLRGARRQDRRAAGGVPAG
jgi:hypothetical protein